MTQPDSPLSGNLEASTSFETINPATGQLIQRYSVAGAESVSQAVAKARAIFPVWKAVSLEARANLLRSVMQALHGRADEIAALISRETGKPLADALEADVGTALGVLGYYANIGPKRLKSRPIQPDLISVITGRLHLETFHPRGVIAIISPWNYPLAIPASGLATALMAGNTVILKPSELTPATGRWLIELVRETLRQHYLPEDIAQCLMGDGSTGAALIQQNVDGIIFTGSDKTGRRIQQAVSGRAVWTSMELGGSDAMLVLEGCPLETAASYALWGRYTNAGQACAAVKRLLIPRHSAAAFLGHLQAKIARLQVGPPENPENHIGPLISEAQLHLLDSQVQDALEKGARLLAGGKRIERPGWFYEPTLLTDVPENARILHEEVFGPVLPVIPYDSPDEAIALMNASAFGLTASVFGPEPQARAIAGRLECGTVVINDVGPSNYAMPCAPWGGWKNSGSGASHGERALLDLSRVQVVSVNRLFRMPGLQKPLWHFGNRTDLLIARSKTVLAFSSAHPSIWNPLTWLAFWHNRASTKI
ncbi:MAG: aldA [Vampirovibrio sp.]|jgi:succinate-semialdehyde dehydrogenase/glutarate-semialdehyde dehydrogenase|nr:aldA [Vampirovibrio sp.]